MKKIFFVFLITILLSFIAATNFQDLIIDKLDDYIKKSPEKVYVHTDKPYYTLGNDIWFTAYLVDGITHKESTKSNVIYVELINDKDSIVATRKLHTKDISAAGEFKIDPDWESGNYLLRAYTNYMRNSNSDYFFKKEIPIWDLKSEVKTALKSANLDSTKETDLVNKKRPDIHFYPEGGYLVEGIQSKVALKIKDKNAKNISGVVKDSDNNTISAFKTFEFGLGSLIFTPKANKTYYIRTVINGKEEKYKLPKALPIGFNLSLLNYRNEITIRASSNTPIGLLNSFILVHQRGKVIYKKYINSDENKFAVKLDASGLNSGVTHVTLFNNNGKPVCERLVFVDNSNAVINIQKNSKNPSTREKVTLQLDLKDGKGNPLTGNLSLAISDLEVVQKNDEDDTIKTYLLLNSDLRGEIENPGYFFKEGDKSKRQFLLDLVMLTHGWSRFKWEELLYTPPKSEGSYEIEKGFYISGQTQALKDRRNFISAPMRITFTKEIPPYQELKKSNENGQFKFGPYAFYDSIPVIIEARVEEFKSDYNKNSDVHISLRKSKYRSPLINREILLKKSKVKEDVVQNFIKQSESVFKIDTAYANSSQRLKEIVIKVKKEREIEIRNKELDSLTDYGTPSRRLDVNEIIGGESSTMLSLLNRLGGVFATTSSIRVRGQTPKIFLDDFLVELEDILYLSGSDVEFIDLLTGANAAFFNKGASGVIIIYSKTNRGIIKNTRETPGIINFDYQGFYTARQFYSPDYSDSFIDVPKQDIRSTLYWNPKIEVKENANAEVTFYTSDSKTDYAIEIEGITNSGEPVYLYDTIKVE